MRQEGVQLNMAAMLDMAFQLLAFFIATFKPMTIEQQIALKLPPPERIKSEAPSQAKPNESVIELLTTMRIGLEATPDGNLASITFLDDSARAKDLNDFVGKLQTRIAANKTTPIQQMIVEIDPRLNLQWTMEVLEKCRGQKLPDGKELTKISPVLATVK